MRLISCEDCGVVIDTDRLVEPNITNEDGSINFNLAIWNGDEYVPAILCPNCSSRITITSGESD